MYCLMISIVTVTPFTVKRQMLCDQNISFHNFSLISGNSFLISLLLADLYALVNLLISVLGCFPLPALYLFPYKILYQYYNLVIKSSFYITKLKSTKNIFTEIFNFIICYIFKIPHIESS